MDEILETYQEDAEILLFKGILLQRLERISEALETYGRGLEINPNSVDLLVSKALSLRSIDELEESAACLIKAHEIEPDNKDLIQEIENSDILLKNKQDKKKLIESIENVKKALIDE